MTYVEELVVVSVMLLTALGTIAAFITFYLDDGLEDGRVAEHRSDARRHAH